MQARVSMSRCLGSQAARGSPANAWEVLTGTGEGVAAAKSTRSPRSMRWQWAALCFAVWLLCIPGGQAQPPSDGAGPGVASDMCVCYRRVYE